MFAADYASEIGLTFSGEQAQLDLSAVNVPPVGNLSQARVTEIVFAGSLPAEATDLMWWYPQKFGSSILRVTRPGQEMQSQWFQAGSGGEPWPLGVAPKRTAFETFVEYAKIGFLHILPKGADHILFVLGLFFLSLKWKPLLAQVTAFTLAHSVTLALGLYGIVQISPAIVEPLIALSIVYVAVENILTRRLHIWRPVVVFLFGLLHGLGFAGILSEIGLPRSDYVLGLVAFNVGVEIGQLAVIAIAFLCVGWFAGRSWYRWRIAIPASVAIGLMGAYWFLERTLLA